MKQTKQQGLLLSLKKSTITRLAADGSREVYGGAQAQQTPTLLNIDKLEPAYPLETCGLVCGDCMSTLQSLRCGPIVNLR